MAARLEHANFTVSDNAKTAQWMQDIFGWHIRWQGPSTTGHTIHVGSDTQYLALHTRAGAKPMETSEWEQIGALNHVAVVVDDIAQMRARVKQAGFTPGTHYDYEPGQRFYFNDHDGIEYEVVQYD